MQDDEKLKIAKAKYIQNQGLDVYQKVLRAISHPYSYVTKDAKDSSDKN